MADFLDEKRKEIQARLKELKPLVEEYTRLEAAERAGTARAREFVFSGDLFDASTLHHWGVVNRVLPDDELLDDARAFARALAAGPTRAHAATKAVVRAQADHGTRGADERTVAFTSHLFETQDSREAVQSFLQHGPGKATFTGK